MSTYRGYIIEETPPLYAPGFDVSLAPDAARTGKMFLKRGFTTEAEAMAWCDRKADGEGREIRND